MLTRKPRSEISSIHIRVGDEFINSGAGNAGNSGLVNSDFSGFESVKNQTLKKRGNRWQWRWWLVAVSSGGGWLLSAGKKEEGIWWLGGKGG